MTALKRRLRAGTMLDRLGHIGSQAFLAMLRPLKPHVVHRDL